MNRTRTWLDAVVLALALGACADDPEDASARSTAQGVASAAGAAQPYSVTGLDERAQAGSSVESGPEEEGSAGERPPLAEAYMRKPEHLMEWIRAEAVGPVEVVRDSVAQQTLYFPQGARTWKPFVAYAYMLERGGVRNYHLFVGTQQPDWLSWNQVSIEVDGASTPLPVSPSGKQANVAYAGVREWIDLPLDVTTRQLLRRIADGERVVVRLSGTSPREFPIDTEGQDHVRQLLRAFDEGTF